MRTDPQSGVVLVGDQIPYSDGAEDTLATIMADTADHSSSSDELATGITDWPSRYHLSRLRSNILRPLAIRPGDRVLDVGAGTGALTRYLGELGADVVALEGSLDRARVTQARCAGLSNVEIVCGPLDSFEDPGGFDLVLLCGVLEYSRSFLGGSSGAEAMLEMAARLTRSTGAVVLAIENQLGLKFLLGNEEEHLGRAWVGVEGYSKSSEIRTWTRRELGDLLGGAGFAEQRWLYPFPDYKLATTVVADRAYDEPDVARFLDQLLRNPIRVDGLASEMPADARRVHRTCLEAGIGRDVANSFLVVASADGAAPDRLIDGATLAWRFGDERRRLWLRRTEVSAIGEGRVARQSRLHEGEGRPEAGWLTQTVAEERPYRFGPTLEQLFLSAAGDRDEERMAEILGRWREELRGQERPRDNIRSAHPFLDADADRLLPPNWLDVSLDNFVDEDGELYNIDDEWVVPDGVSPEVAVTRALWWLARRMVMDNIDHPWSPTLDADSLAGSIGRLCGEVLDRDRLESFRSAEADFQTIVGDSDREALLGELVRQGSLSSFSLGLQNVHAVGVLARVQRERDDLVEKASEVEERELRVEELERQAGLIDAMAEKLNHALRELHNERLQSEELVETMQRIRGRLPIRVYLKVKRLLGAAV